MSENKAVIPYSNDASNYFTISNGNCTIGITATPKYIFAVRGVEYDRAKLISMTTIELCALLDSMRTIHVSFCGEHLFMQTYVENIILTRRIDDLEQNLQTVMKQIID